jgi:hypothetical protein
MHPETDAEEVLKEVMTGPPQKLEHSVNEPEIMRRDYHFQMLHNDILLKKIMQDGGRISNNNEAYAFTH